MKKKDIYSTDQEAQLAGLFSPLRETIIADDGFTDRVMQYIPRRDISMWVISSAWVCGVVVAMILIGKENALMLLSYFRDFVSSVAELKMPSEQSFTALLCLMGVLGLMVYAALDTDDYCEDNYI